MQVLVNATLVILVWHRVAPRVLLDRGKVHLGPQPVPHVSIPGPPQDQAQLILAHVSARPDQQVQTAAVLVQLVAPEHLKRCQVRPYVHPVKRTRLQQLEVQ